ncbi:hypothetical protein FOL47_007806 [Perkinsus chesapeaki]|uniref:non-specific serine/threonine protein kinase n=1 Tax=Perkinsus chesapeaki TaxID=330153 RepID=A0A7J6LIJ1_PERCH|nr:hypothetical protein FOL47_007806 [Perkinsus chesapeaki]
MDHFYSLPAVQESPPRMASQSPLADVSCSSSVARTSSVHEKRYHSDSNLNQISLEYAYTELAEATDNFDESAKLGSGSYGSVYKGTLQDGTEVAIKVVDLPNEAGFEDEVRVLSKFRHPNLVILMGFARNGSQRLLVYECLSGGDVSVRLQKCAREGVPFPWQLRLSIALDAACGLSHLHNAKPKVFHRDIKSPNILLDRNSTAKMADFGLACLSHGQSHKVKQASGTIGYACPYYIQRGVVTEASEVYSFGMVLLELLLNAPPACPGPKPGEILYLVNHLNGDLMRCLSMVDPRAGYPPNVAKQLAELALSCASMAEESRPTFVQVVKSLRAMLTAAEAAVTPQPSPALMIGGNTTSSAFPAAAHFNIQPGLFMPPHTGQSNNLSALSPSTPAQPFRPFSKFQIDQQSTNRQAGRQSPPPPPRASSSSQRSVHLPPPPPLSNTESSSATSAAAKEQLEHGMSTSAAAATAAGAAPAVATLLTLTCTQWDATRENASSSSVSSSSPSVPPSPSPSQQHQPPLIMQWEHKCQLPGELVREDCPRSTRIAAQYPPLRLGRNHQVALFDSLVSSPTLRTTISRDHLVFTFERCNSGTDQRHMVGVYVSNLSGNSVFINQSRLLVKGDKFGPLEDGTTITFVAVHGALDGGESGSGVSEEPTPFLTFRVDLGDSWLNKVGIMNCQQPRGEIGSQATSLTSEVEEGSLQPQEAGAPCVFALEVQAEKGDGEGLSIEHHSLDEALLVGRSRQPQLLWQLLKGEYNAVSREHFEIRTVKLLPYRDSTIDGGGGSGRVYGFKVKCLSCNGITLVEGGGGCKEGCEKPRKQTLSQNDPEVDLYHGDELAIADLTRFLFVDCINPPTSAVRPLTPKHLFDPQDENDAFARSGFQLVQDSKGVRVAATGDYVKASSSGGPKSSSKHRHSNQHNSTKSEENSSGRSSGRHSQQQSSSTQSKTGVSAWTKFSSVTGLFKNKGSSKHS